MKSVLFREHHVYFYHSMLYTRSPLLKEIYCESHRFEPWAVRGDARRMGYYRFPNVLYVERDVRDRLLSEIGPRVMDDPGYPLAVQARFTAASKELARAIRHTRLGRTGPADLDRLIGLAARVLSSGVFKEVLEPAHVAGLLSDFIPPETVREALFRLYQPLCLPHFLKLELKLLHFAHRYEESGRDEDWVQRAIAQCAHLSKFLLEETELHRPDAMRQKLLETVETWGGAEGVRRRRLALLDRHRAAVDAAHTADEEILGCLDRFGRYSLRAKLVVMGLLRFIQFVSTAEEIKHIQVVQAARALYLVMAERGLKVETTGREELLAAVTARP